MVLLFVVLALVVAGCHSPSHEPPPRASAPERTAPAVTTPPPAPEPVVEVPVAPPLPPGPAVVEKITVPSDSDASIVRALDGAPPKIAFVPGVCSNANAYLQAFPESARRHGGIVAVEGDQPCIPGFHTFSWDAVKLDARVRAAITAAGGDADAPGGITLVGYSQGAALGEQMIQRWPDRYTRLVLIGAPTDPSAAHFKTAKGVVTMSCSRDVTYRMKDAARRISASGVPSLYVEMPGCTHGNIADGDVSFDAAFDFLQL